VYCIDFGAYWRRSHDLSLHGLFDVEYSINICKGTLFIVERITEAPEVH
jgi:hypothetical protein